MKRKKRICIVLLAGMSVILSLFFLPSAMVFAQQESLIPDIDYTKIQEALDDASKEDDFNFEEYVSELFQGKEPLSFSGILSKIKSVLSSQLMNSMSSLVKLVTIAVVAAVFTNFSHTFQNSQVAETGFYVSYLLMFVILSATFVSVTVIASDALSKILQFMKALVPAYCMSIAFCTGTVSSAAYYEGILILITAVDFLLLKVVFPLVNIYMMAILANNLTKEDMLSKLADLLSTTIRWILNTTLTVVLGIGTVQKLIVPAFDSVKRTSIVKLTTAIPGVGRLLEGVTETVLGAGKLLRNCIGVGGMVAIIIICAIPIIKIAVYVLVYKLCSAAIQPISDKRIVNCVSSASDATAILLRTVVVAMVLFELAITIAADSTFS